MAKDIDNDDDDKFEKMDDESLGFLEQVKKGRSRFFILSMKGAKVRSLIVKKKPIKDRDRKAARGEGFQPVFGVATGAGAAISFTVARSDGFDEKTADAKTDKLKKFLKHQTGKPFKPAFELVDMPPPIPFDEEDLNDPLIARFMALESQISEACDQFPESVSWIQGSVNTIRGLLQDDETRSSAEPKIGELETYLAGLQNNSAAGPVSPTPDQGAEAAANQATVAPAIDGADTFKKRLAALLPRIKEAVGTPHGDEAKLKASEAGVFARQQKFDQANAVLDDVERLLNGSPAPAAPIDDATRAAKIAEALKKLKPLMDQVISIVPERKGELHATMVQIAGEIKNKQFDDAKRNVMDFATLLKSLATQQPSSSTGFVDYTKARLAWDAARKDVRTELQTLEDAILAASENELDFDEIAENCGNLYEMLDVLDERLIDTLDDLLNESDSDRQQELRRTATTILGEYAEYVANDGMLQEIDQNEFKPVKVYATLQSTLSDLRSQLA